MQKLSQPNWTWTVIQVGSNNVFGWPTHPTQTLKALPGNPWSLFLVYKLIMIQLVEIWKTDSIFLSLSIYLSLSLSFSLSLSGLYTHSCLSAVCLYIPRFPNSQQNLAPGSTVQLYRSTVQIYSKMNEPNQVCVYTEGNEVKDSSSIFCPSDVHAKHCCHYQRDFFSS